MDVEYVAESHVGQTAWARAWRWRETGSFCMNEALADVAYDSGLPSAAAVLDVLVTRGRVQSYRGEFDLSELARRFYWSVDALEIYSNDEDGFVGPEESEPPYHDDDCWCDECHAMHGCDDHPCAICSPDCDCDDCYDNPAGDLAGGADDPEDGQDSWPGLPERPNAAPGRCRFGIEIEFNGGSRGGIVQSLVASGLAAREVAYTHEVVRYWKLTTDSTVTGGELVSPIMDGSNDSIEEVKEAIRIVKANGGQPSQPRYPQGMHVHMDVSEFRTRQLKALVHNLRAGQQFLAAYVPPSRLTNYNRLLRAVDWEALDSWVENVDMSNRDETGRRGGHCPVDRGVDFNFNALMPYGTVEFRLLGSTLNTLRVSTWIRVLQCFIEASRNINLMPSGDILSWLAGVGLENEHIERFRSVVHERGNQARLMAA